jgi:hypothetical protein
MTTPAQPGPYPGQSGASWPTAPAPGQAGPAYPNAPQPDAAPYGYNYGWQGPAYGYPQQPGPGASPQDRGTAILLLVGAVLAVAGSFPSLTKAVDTTAGSAENTITYYDKPWSLSSQGTSFNNSALQFLGLPLALGAAMAIVIAILLLVGFGARRGPVRALGLAGSGILFGAALMVMMVAVDDGQFDNSTHHTSFEIGFWLIVLCAVASLGAAVPGIAARFGSPTDAEQSAAPPLAPASAYGMQPPVGLQPPTAQYMQQPPQAYAQQPPQAQPQQQQPPQFDPGARWEQPGQPSAPASPEDPQQPTG